MDELAKEIHKLHSRAQEILNCGSPVPDCEFDEFQECCEKLMALLDGAGINNIEDFLNETYSYNTY